jgi:hypothetical protein
MLMVPSARYASLSGFVEVTQALGLDPARLMTSVDLDPAGLARPDTWIPAARIARLLELAAAAAKRSDFGLRLAEHRALAALGPLSLILRDEPDVRSALELIIRYEHSYNEALRMRLAETNGVATLRLWFEFGEPVASRQADELALAVLRGILGEFLGPDWRTTHRRLRPPSTRAPHHPPPGPRSPAPLRPRVHRTGPLQHRPRHPHQSGIGPQPRGRGVLSAPSAPPAVSRQRTGRSRSSSCCCRPAAARPCTSRRPWRWTAGTLHRHLARSGTTFAELVDRTRAGLAERHLAGDRYRITDISELLGFAAPSAFTRWFRHHFDVSPTQWRRSARTPPDAAAPPHTGRNDQTS